MLCKKKFKESHNFFMIQLLQYNQEKPTSSNINVSIFDINYEINTIKLLLKYSLIFFSLVKNVSSY